jgi:photosystem II stability/assembly factor-like uncharacterized protein
MFSATGCSKTDLSTLGNNIVCYAAAYNNGVYKSDNGGISWYPLASDQEDIYFYSKKLFMSQDAKKLYVATTGAGLFYIDMEKGVLNKVSGFKDEDVRSVVFKKASDGQGTGLDIVVGKKETGIFKSVEGTTIWEPFNNGLTYRDINVLYKRADNLYAGTTNGLFKWDEAAKTWVDISQGIKNKNIIAINSDPEGKAIYVGAGAYQNAKGRFQDIPSLYKSTDNGKSWEDSDKGLPDGILVFSVALNPQKSERIYLGTSDGIYRSTDSGKEWSKMKNGLPKELKVLDIRIAQISADNDLVYAAGDQGLFMALDEPDPVWISRSYGLDKTVISSIVLQSN